MGDFSTPSSPEKPLLNPGSILSTSHLFSEAQYETGGTLLGAGSYGQVLSGKRVPENKEVAIKVSRKTTTFAMDDELEIMEWLQMGGCHRNVARLLDVVTRSATDSGSPPPMTQSLILARYSGNLDDWLEKVDVGIPVGVYAEITREIFSALAYIHDKTIVHNDLYLRNVFVSKHEGCIKIGDFGESFFVHKKPDTEVSSLEYFQRDMCNFTEMELISMWTGLMWSRHTFDSEGCEGFDEFRKRGVSERDIQRSVELTYDYSYKMSIEADYYSSHNWKHLMRDEPDIRKIADDMFAWHMKRCEGPRGRPIPQRFVRPFMAALLIGPIETLTSGFVLRSFNKCVSKEVRLAANLYIRDGTTHEVLTAID
eukprot:scpid74088/ scgid20018/ Ephrin type-A receptor 3; EPH-like kinase 4; Tyrosine-protein kinase TYRO4; Tyrosine-protein kinase receptor ETK1